jgi:gliding motility-associated-like protein
MTKPIHVTVSKNPVLTINNQTACGSVNITTPTGFISNQSDIISSFWMDSAATKNLPSPDSIKLSGTYYVKATNSNGCSTIAAIPVTVLHVPKLVVNIPAPVCLPNTIDLTNTAITAGSEVGLVFHYWNDSAATNSLSNPQLIDLSGTYFIKVTNADGCSIVKPVAVTVLKSALLTIHDQTACGFVNINSPIGFSSDQTDIKTSFWQDSNTTINVAAPDSIKVSGTYFIKVTNNAGCSTVAAIKTIVFPIPYFTIAQNPVVYLPATIDLTALVKPTTNTIASFTYWQDPATTIAVVNPSSVTVNGMYYIKLASTDGCMVLDSVTVTIKTPPIIPPNVFSPNGDGINDTWDIALLQFFPTCSVEVFNRYGQLVFKSKGYNKNWDGTFNQQTLPIGTYYYIIKTSPGANPISGSVLILR